VLIRIYNVTVRQNLLRTCNEWADEPPHEWADELPQNRRGVEIGFAYIVPENPVNIKGKKAKSVCGL
jgi:hypothetical protein